MVRRVRPADLVRRHHASTGQAELPRDLLAWTEAHRRFGEHPMRIPAPLRALYRDDSPYVVVMKGAQLGLSEWAINVPLHTADTGRAGRGTSLSAPPGGETVGDFVPAPVTPHLPHTPYLPTRAP